MTTRDNSDDASSNSAQPAPLNINDLMLAFAAAQQRHEPSTQKVALPITVALAIGLIGWVGTTLGSLETTVAAMQPTLAIIQKSLDTLATNQKDSQDKIANIESQIAQDNLRLDDLENRKPQH